MHHHRRGLELCSQFTVIDEHVVAAAAAVNDAVCCILNFIKTQHNQLFLLC